MRKKIGIAYYTTKFSFNQVTLLDSFQKMLGDSFALHLFVPEREYKKFKEQGVKGYKVHFISAGTGIITKDALTTIPRICKQENIQVISNLINFSVHGFHIALAGKKAGIASVGLVGAEEMRNYKKVTQLGFKVKLFLIKRLFGGAVTANLVNTIQALGPNLSEMMKKEGFVLNKNKVITLPQPVDASQFGKQNKKQCRERLGISQDEEIVLYVGRVAYLKGSDRLLKTIRRLPEKQFYIAGQLQSFRGESVEGLRNKLEALPNARYLGAVPHEEISQYYGAADVLFQSSRDEGLPHTIMEAMASGMPVVATDVGDVSFLAPPVVLADDSNFAVKLQYALEHRGQLRQAGREKIESEFSVEALRPRYQRFFKELIRAK